MGLKWDQAEELAEVLAENHPGLNPLDARFTDLRQWVIDLDEFDDNREGSTKQNWKRSRWHGTKSTRNRTKRTLNRRRGVYVQNLRGGGQVEEARSTTLKTDNGEKMQEKETLDERLPGLFEPDTLLPIQYFEAMRKKHLLEGEKRLILSVLEDAIECFMKCIDASTSKGQRLFRDADEWIAHEDKRWVFRSTTSATCSTSIPSICAGACAGGKTSGSTRFARRRAQMVLEAERAASEAALQPAGAIAAIAAAPVAAATAAAIQKPDTKVAGQSGGARQAPPRTRAHRQARVSAQAAQSARIRTGTQEWRAGLRPARHSF